MQGQHRAKIKELGSPVFLALSAAFDIALLSSKVLCDSQKSASSTTAGPLSGWLLGSKPAVGRQAAYPPSTDLQAWLSHEQTSEDSQVCCCLHCF